MNHHTGYDEEHHARAVLSYAAEPGDTRLPALAGALGTPATLRLLTCGSEAAAVRQAARHAQIPVAGIAGTWRSRLADAPCSTLSLTGHG